MKKMALAVFTSICLATSAQAQNVSDQEAYEIAKDGTAGGRALVTKLGKEAGGEGGKGWVYTTRSGAYGVDYPSRRHRPLLSRRKPAAGCRLSLAFGRQRSPA